ncbi:transposase [Candidatus Collierbacteria bacterium]|nr:transposase [Candidatus Collierbacteria bacterium]
MTSIRKEILAINEIYHVYNRGVEQRPIFVDKFDYARAIKILDYYRFDKLPLGFFDFINLPQDKRENITTPLLQTESFRVNILSFSLMPNHFHLLLRQKTENGISSFISDFSNSHAKYFNSKNSRVGSLFQRPFHARRIETPEQLVHVSRYIHINHVSNYLIEDEALDNYPRTSMPEYLGKVKNKICETETVLSHFNSIQDYRGFVHDQVGYARELEKIKHLAIDFRE